MEKQPVNDRGKKASVKAPGVTMVTSTHSITPLLQELHWLPVVWGIQFMVLAITFKALHGVDPGYLKELGGFSRSHRLRKLGWWGSRRGPSPWLSPGLRRTAEPYPFRSF